MTRFNIIGKGFVELEDNGGIALKTENQQFRFAEISLGRSVQFAIPATDANRSLLGFADDPAETGEAFRRIFDAQMVYDGGVRNGALAVTAYTGDTFACVFYMDGASWIEALQKKRLADCVCTLPSVVWGLSTPVVDADQADPFTGVQIVRYENGASHHLRQLTPSVNVWAYLQDILTNMGVLFSLPVSLQSLWITSASMKGGGDDNVTLATTSQTTGTVTETVADYYFTVVPITVQSYKTGFGQIFNPTFTNVVGFRARRNLTIDVPQSYDDDVKMILWNNVSAGRYVELEYGEVRGKTITLHKDDTIFFSRKGYGQTNAEPYVGWKTIEAPFSVTLAVKRSEDLQDGETWSVQNNAPDMTVFELLKSVAVATGLELSVDAVTGIAFHDCQYGGLADFKALDRVVSVDDVRRNVAAWGNDTASLVVKFDSEDYVEERITSVYDVDNSQSKGTKDIVAKFSEGGVGDHGVLIQDVDSTGAKFEAKKWTLSRVDSGADAPTYLQRILAPDVEGCDDVAMMSTCVKVKVAASQAAFMSLLPSTTFTWHGMAYVWTDSDWSDGVMSLTLQKVSQPSVVIPDEPMVRVEWLESKGTQFIDLGIVPDDATGVKIWLQSTGSTGYVYGIADEASPSTKRIGIGVNPTGPGCVWGAQFVNSGQAFTEGVIELNFENSREFKITQGVTTFTASLSALGFTPVGTLHVFGRGGAAGVLLSKWIGRISRVKVSQGSDVVRDLVAVRVGSVGYMYDRISGTLYANSGTGAFVVGRDLPYDAEVEYLESDGTQYIDTGILGKESIKLYARFNYPNASSATGSGRLFGSRQTSSSNAFAVGTSSGIVAANNNKMFVCFDSQPYYIIDSVFDINTWHEISFGASDIELDGLSYGSQYTSTPFTTPQTLKLFGFDNGGTLGYGRVRVSSYKIWDGTTLLQDLVPVRKDGVGYMYDRVSGQLFGNDGTGDFIIGPDV